jgi:hypothetical protein
MKRMEDMKIEDRKMGGPVRRRIAQSAWCCGHVYLRWRWPGREFGPGHMTCIYCGAKLKWRERERQQRAVDQALLMRRLRLSRRGEDTGRLPARVRGGGGGLGKQERAWREFRAGIAAELAGAVAAGLVLLGAAWLAAGAVQMPTQGSGALELIKLMKLRVAGPGEMEPAGMPAVPGEMEPAVPGALVLPSAAPLPTSKAVALAWDAAESTWPVTNYAVYWGGASRVYTNHINCRTNLSGTVSNLVKGRSYYFGATATDSKGSESAYSNEVTNMVPVLKTSLVLTLTSSRTNWAPIMMTNPPGQYFYRMAATKSGNTWTVRMQRSDGDVKGPWANWSTYWANWTTNGAPQVRLYLRKEWQ